jgi:hypothetical protein
MCKAINSRLTSDTVSCSPYQELKKYLSAPLEDVDDVWGVNTHFLNLLIVLDAAGSSQLLHKLNLPFLILILYYFQVIHAVTEKKLLLFE